MFQFLKRLFKKETEKMKAVGNTVECLRKQKEAFASAVAHAIKTIDPNFDTNILSIEELCDIGIVWILLSRGYHLEPGPG
jgi:hypothetical protein